ncbi:AAA family ATPase [Neotamlana laminarinivorans]|uniref:ATP-binding protein n=1 Tax=Neotamlana laminarinivorans TaxID=2883124 RepID=A0A9X1L015_9FLAO|nr:ATP-binding protein [Tamlana laminarinivorans]MCB4797353.1 ATP-binding protein [Tamlana laminarinivorans]
MIERLIVKKLNNKTNLDLSFEPDLNLLTGKNGSSKTTILKLIWFLNSGRIVSLIREIVFEYAELTTSEFRISIKQDSNSEKISVNFNNDPTWSLSQQDLRNFEFRMHPRYQKRFHEIQNKSIPTVFFPTFRRIEGGFSMDRHDPRFHSDSLKDAMNEFSERLSSFNQKFVASISTDDIVSLLTKEYAEINSKINKMQKEKSDSIIAKIKNRTKDETSILNDIQNDIEGMENERNSLFKPFTILSDLITTIFQHKGIHLSNLTFGDVSDSVASEKLSAGEKQMLSFICYNIFTKNSTIFIDEPELSLHPDWQRTLVPTLLNQGNSNQFFMATHSPFIYSKYSDKEIILSNDKGQ